MPELVLSPKAERDLEDIWNFVAKDNPKAADRLVRRLLEKVELASEQPGIGAPRPELSRTARILIEGRYLIIYEPIPEGEGITVIAVVHGMRDPKSWIE